MLSVWLPGRRTFSLKSLSSLRQLPLLEDFSLTIRLLSGAISFIAFACVFVCISSMSLQEILLPGLLVFGSCRTWSSVIGTVRSFQIFWFWPLAYGHSRLWLWLLSLDICTCILDLKSFWINIKQLCWKCFSVYLTQSKWRHLVAK